MSCGRCWPRLAGGARNDSGRRRLLSESVPATRSAVALLVTPEESRAPVTGTTRGPATRPATGSEAITTTAASTARPTTTKAQSTAPAKPPPPPPRFEARRRRRPPRPRQRRPSPRQTSPRPLRRPRRQRPRRQRRRSRRQPQGRAVANVLAEEAFWHGLRWMRLAGIEPAERSRQAC